MSESARPANRLIDETSPYLLQHAHNPVEWYPWGEEAFERARREEKPILLSVGYSACHWCHVMERESFENDEIAALMNRHFVSVKVDREERPDVDHIYMQVVQAMTGHGGWPMTVFLTPDGLPIFGGTYFPPTDMRGMPGFPRVLNAIATAWERHREEAVSTGRDLIQRLQHQAQPLGERRLLTEELLAGAFRGLSRTFDERRGGTGGAPKFPQPMTWEFVLRCTARGDDERAAQMVRTTLDEMARGGIYDQLGGGFHRYSVDARWLVPHFEKMLYDNGQLARLYLDAYRAFAHPEYRRICEETLDYIAREMTADEGGFYSSQDADSEGEEGKFFVWTPDEVEEALDDPGLYEVAATYWGLDGGPNFEGRSILYRPRSTSDVASLLSISPEAVEERLATARERLLEVRSARVWPGRDDKVLTAWNGLTARAFAEAGKVLDRPDYVACAAKNARFVLSQLRRDDGRLLRTWKAGQAKLNGYLEDYAQTIDALLALYGATFDADWLARAKELADAMIDLFWDADEEVFYDTGRDHEALVVRPRDTMDNAAPCGSSVAVDVLLRLAVLAGEGRYADCALPTLRSVAPLVDRYPGGFGRFLVALDFHLGPVAELAFVWPAGGDAGEFLAPLRRRYVPNKVVVGAVAGSSPEGIPLLDGRGTVDSKPTAYLCRENVCQLPVTSWAELEAQLEAF